ncbi:hypothetical protein YB2330_006142 [Saitoella coloradoensis]
MSNPFAALASDAPSSSNRVEENTVDEQETDDLEFLSLRPDTYLVVSPPWPEESFPPASSCLLAVSKQGLYVVGTQTGFVGGRTSTLRDGLKGASDMGRIQFDPEVRVECGGPATHVAFSADERMLLVALGNGQILFYDVQQVLAGSPPNPQGSLLSSNGVRVLAPNPENDSVALLGTAGELSIINLSPAPTISNTVATGVTSVSWSKKGKQIAAGLGNGTIINLTPAGETKRTVAPPPSLPGVYVSSLFWLENNVFLAVYNNSTNTPQDPVHEYQHIIVNVAKDKTTYTSTTEPTPPFGLTSRDGHNFFAALPCAWNDLNTFVVTAATPSTDIGVYARSASSALTTFTISNEIRRAALPLSESGMDTSPLGLALDFSLLDTSVDNPLSVGGPEAASGLPVIWSLDSEGGIGGWWVVWAPAVKAGVPYQVSQSGNTPAATGPTSPSVGFGFGAKPAAPAAGFGFGSAPQPVAGTPGGFGFGAAAVRSPATGTGFGFGGTPREEIKEESMEEDKKQGAPSKSAFGAAPVFGQSSTPGGAFGSSVFGQSTTGSAFGASAFTKPSTPGTASVFGQASTPTSTFAASSPSAFTSNPGSAFNQPSTPSGSAFGQTSTPSAFQSSTPSAFNTPPKPASAFGQTSTPTSAFGSSTFGKPSTLGANSAFGQTSTLGSRPTFGSTSTIGANSAFGKPAVLGGGSVFGQSSFPAAPASGSVFGSTSKLGNTGGFASFANTPATGFGAAAGESSVFGSSTGPSQPSTFSFAGKVETPRAGSPVKDDDMEDEPAEPEKELPIDEEPKAETASNPFAGFGGMGLSQTKETAAPAPAPSTGLGSQFGRFGSGDAKKEEPAVAKPANSFSAFGGGGSAFGSSTGSAFGGSAFAGTSAFAQAAKEQVEGSAETEQSPVKPAESQVEEPAKPASAFSFAPKTEDKPASAFSFAPKAEDKSATAFSFAPAADEVKPAEQKEEKTETVIEPAPLPPMFSFAPKSEEAKTEDIAAVPLPEAKQTDDVVEDSEQPEVVVDAAPLPPMSAFSKPQEKKVTESAPLPPFPFGNKKEDTTPKESVQEKDEEGPLTPPAMPVDDEEGSENEGDTTNLSDQLDEFLQSDEEWDENEFSEDEENQSGNEEEDEAQQAKPSSSNKSPFSFGITDEEANSESPLAAKSTSAFSFKKDDKPTPPAFSFAKPNDPVQSAFASAAATADKPPKVASAFASAFAKPDESKPASAFSFKSAETKPAFSFAPQVTETDDSTKTEETGEKQVEEPSKGTETKTPTGGFNWAAAGMKAPEKKAGWECTVCMISNKDEDSKCAACETPKPGEKPVEEPTMSKGFNWAAAGMKAPERKAGWECSVCMISNKDEDNTCVACETAKPGAAPAAADVKPKIGGAFQFTPSGPAVPSGFSLAGAAAPDAEKPKPAGFSFAEPTKPSPSGFSFPAASGTDSAPGAKPAGGFSFGTPAPPAATPSSPKKAAPAFGSFGAPVAPATPATEKAGFSFGTTPAGNTPASSGFGTFGAKPAETKVAPSGFGFGAPKQTESKTTTPKATPKATPAPKATEEVAKLQPYLDYKQAKVIQESDCEARGVVGEFERNFLQLNEELSILEKNAARLAEFVSAHTGPSAQKKTVDDLVPAKQKGWKMGDVEAISEIVAELHKQTDTIKVEKSAAEETIKELQGARIKFEAKRTEIQRYIRARQDKDYAMKMRGHHLAPEHAELQRQLRKSTQEVERLLGAMEEKVFQVKAKLGGGGGPEQKITVGRLRRAIENIELDAEIKQNKVDQLEKALESVRLGGHSRQRSFAQRSALPQTPTRGRRVWGLVNEDDVADSPVKHTMLSTPGFKMDYEEQIAVREVKLAKLRKAMKRHAVVETTAPK